MYCDSLSDHVVLPSVGKCIAGVGWTGTAVPERFGGVGLGYVDLCVIAEEIGRCVAPVPFSSSVYLAVEAILRGGDEAQKRAWLPKLASGETVGTFALSEGTGPATARSEEHPSELPSLMRISYAVFCLKKTNKN